MDAFILDLDDTLIVEEATARASLAEALAFAGAPDADGTAAEDIGGSAVRSALDCARRHWYQSPYADDCRRLGIASWEGLWATFEGCHPSLDGLEQWASVYRQAAWEDILRALGADTSRASDVAEGYVAAQRRGHPPIASAVDAARRMGAAVPTGVLTNGPPDIQRLKLSQTGLEFAADAVVISAEVGFGKPEPAAFSLALDRLGSRASGTIMVGDSWERDIVGAVNTGMGAVWVGKGRAPPEELGGVMVVDELTPMVFDRL
jgi:putative hydrolase of the HAD superfamily